MYGDRGGPQIPRRVFALGGLGALFAGGIILGTELDKKIQSHMTAAAVEQYAESTNLGALPMYSETGIYNDTRVDGNGLTKVLTLYDPATGKSVEAHGVNSDSMQLHRLVIVNGVIYRIDLTREFLTATGGFNTMDLGMTDWHYAWGGLNNSPTYLNAYQKWTVFDVAQMLKKQNPDGGSNGTVSIYLHTGQLDGLDHPYANIVRVTSSNTPQDSLSHTNTFSLGLFKDPPQLIENNDAQDVNAVGKGYKMVNGTQDLGPNLNVTITSK